MDLKIEKADVTRPAKIRRAKGKPGGKPLWSSGAKTLVGTAASARSRVWYTISDGTLNEIFFGDVEQANTRSVRFLVTGPDGYFSDEASDAEHQVTSTAGEPCCHIESRCGQGRYLLQKDVLVDPVHNAVIVRVRFLPSAGSDLKLYLTVDAHIADMGANNDGWVGEYKGRPVLVAQRGAIALAVTCSASFSQSSCGYAGKSDGCTLLSQGKPLPDANLAEQGNVDLTAQVEYAASDGQFIFAIGFGTTPPEAAQEATAGILQDYDKVREHFASLWREEQARYAPIEDLSGSPIDMYRISTAVLETHQSKRFPGGFIASLSMPWGFACSDEDTIGYHVLWPRDMVESAMGKLACGDSQTARSTLFFLRCTQEETGGWSQNLFLDGTPYWSAVQMDGTALPILLADQLRREDALNGYNATPMVEAAARFLLQHGPATEQDRWEALPGYSPYTTATEVAALLAAADFIELAGNPSGAEFLRETADAWQDTVDEFTYVAGTALADAHGVAGYYVRMAPPSRVQQETMGDLSYKMSNLPFGKKRHLAADIVSPDALALVRFGLRAADDSRIVDTVKVLDATLKRQTATGPAWVRSSEDGYGEKADGSPFHKVGIGRGWPLLAGERAHFELAAGNRVYALELLQTMARQTSECGMIPEQVWDAEDIPDHHLFNGRPTGSSMPLVWAHAEYIKLLRSLHSGKVWDLPPQTVQRYQAEKRSAAFQIWTPAQQRAWLAPDKDLRIDLPAPALLYWQAGKATGEMRTTDTGYGLHCATLKREVIATADRIRVRVEPADPGNSKLEQQSFSVRRRRA